VKLAAGLPIDEVRCISHKVETEFEDKGTAMVKLGAGEERGANRDFVLQYRLAGKEVASGLLLYEDPGGEENFFLLNVQPPKRPQIEEVPPREYVFVVDVSGSMRGFPLETSKALLRELLPKLRPADRFNVVLFAGSHDLLSQRSLPATEQNVSRAIELIDRHSGGGGTEMLPPIRTAFEMESDEGMSRSILLVTDGLVTYEKATFDLIRDSLGEANVFTFGIGKSINRLLIEGVAHAGCGEPVIVTRAAEASSAARRFWNYVSTPVLTDIEIDYGGLDVYDVEPPSVPDVIADRPVVVFGKWRGKAEDAGEVKLTGKAGDRDVEMSSPIADALAAGDEAGPEALPYLWARKRIAMLGDYRKLSNDNETVEEITQLGLSYNLLTDYTSFVAVDDAPVKKGAAAAKRPQTSKPRPTPEPGVAALTLIGFATLLLRRRR
jgi:Ca-activated chloride channel family protein